MTLGLAFWILMLIWLIFGLYWNWPNAAAGQYAPVGSNLLLFVLLLLLGWHSFGAPLRSADAGQTVLTMQLGEPCPAWSETMLLSAPGCTTVNLVPVRQ